MAKDKEEKPVEISVEDNPSTRICSNPSCGKVIYNSEKCSCQQTKEK